VKLSALTDEVVKFRAQWCLELTDKTAHNFEIANYLRCKLVITLMEIRPFSGLVTTH